MSALIFYATQNPDQSQMIRDGLCKNDDSLQEPSYRSSEPYVNRGRWQDVDILWTRSNFPAMFSDSNRVSAENCMSQRWEWYWPITGCAVRKVVSGVVKDSAGTAISGATVNLFNTTTGLLVDTQTSAADGSYRCGDPNNVTSFAVAYKTGSPDTAGTTINTVTGS